MEKNWLIRTKNNHILGPVSKAKVKELIANGSLKGDDEICSGNGYWLFIREKDLVDKYVHGDLIQDFNPVCEASTVLAISEGKNLEENDQENGQVDVQNVYPVDQDLDYPDLEEVGQSSAEDNGDLTLVGGVDLSQLKGSGSREIELEEEILDSENSIEDIPEDIPEDTTKNSSPKRKSLNKGQRKVKQSSSAQKTNLSGSILYIIAFVFVFLILLSLYFRNSIINSFNNDNDKETVSFQLINSAHAQIKDGIIEKKKPLPFHQ